MAELTPDLIQRIALTVGDVAVERGRQQLKWGEQHHPDGTGSEAMQFMANFTRRCTEDHAALGAVTWRDILREEFYEAMAETDPAALRKELVQVAAVAVAWVEDIDGRCSDG